eukprot:1160917-Pelagomonas_calceolata.AAC.7
MGVCAQNCTLLIATTIQNGTVRLQGIVKPWLSTCTGSHIRVGNACVSRPDKHRQHNLLRNVNMRHAFTLQACVSRPDKHRQHNLLRNENMRHAFTLQACVSRPDKHRQHNLLRNVNLRRALTLQACQHALTLRALTLRALAPACTHLHISFLLKRVLMQALTLQACQQTRGPGPLTAP